MENHGERFKLRGIPIHNEDRTTILHNFSLHVTLFRQFFEEKMFHSL